MTDRDPFKAKGDPLTANQPEEPEPNALHFAGTDWSLNAVEISEQLLEALKDCATPGQAADEAVAYVLETFTVTGDVLDCAAYLKRYGAWDAEELADHDVNLSRLVWLTGVALHEGEPAYFSTY
jgi:hypothetical protein